MKDRTSGTITIVAVIAAVIMVVAFIAVSASKPNATPTLAAPTAPSANNTASQTTASNTSGASSNAGIALATTAAGSGIQTTADGLQYRIITQGTGPKPKATDTVTVNYRGILTDGTVFDSSYDRGQPTSFAVNQVIPGWTEGLQLMPVGSTYIFTIPANLAYGANPPTSSIPPNSTLIFQVDLISIQGQ